MDRSIGVIIAKFVTGCMELISVLLDFLFNKKFWKIKIIVLCLFLAGILCWKGWFDAISAFVIVVLVLGIWKLACWIHVLSIRWETVCQRRIQDIKEPHTEKERKEIRDRVERKTTED